MLELLKQNKLYISLVLLFWLVGSICLLTIPKGHTIAWLHQSGYQAYYPLWLHITRLAEQPIVTLTFLILLLLHRPKAVAFAILTLLSMTLSLLLKNYFSAPRPYLYFQQHDLIHLLQTNLFRYPLADFDTSFPSGHTIMAFSLYTFLALNTPYRWLAIPCFVAAILVALSRIALSQHFFEDVFAGSIIGFATALLVSHYLKIYQTSRTKH